jgi:hypothetical protein
MFNSRKPIMPLISIQQLASFQAGTVLKVSHGLYYHFGLLGPQVITGERAVISQSSQKGGLLLEPYSSFASGREVICEGYPSALPPQLVLQRAMEKQGKRYSLRFFNCEHLIRHAHGLSPRSPQVEAWAFLAGVITLLCLVNAKS